MIAELGQYLLALALLVAVVQASVPLWGAARGDLRVAGLADGAARAQAVLVAASFAALLHLYVTSDFSVLNVVQNSHSAKPMLYKVSAAWGNHEGSMLLWVLILAIYGAAVAMFGGNLPPLFRARVLAVQGLISAGFLAFILFTSNPFERVVPAPLDGEGFNPLLQDPGLAFHPPFLYLGYVGFSMAFSFAVAALIEGRVDAAWARWVRPWTLAAWSALTLGIALGSWWAYYELGWGGFWFWDPVENASLMPWLAGTALLHSAVVVEKREALKSWTLLLAILTFSLSLLGAFLVRSGVLTSVHAFANAPERGAYILALMLVLSGGSLLLYAVRAPGLAGGGLFRPVSREGALILNNLLLTAATLAVFLGTLYPLFLEVLSGTLISVGPPYFDAVFVPIMAPLMAAVVVGPLLAWKRGDLAAALGRLKFALLAAVLAVGLTAWIRGELPTALAYLGVALAAWLVVGAFVEVADRMKLFRTGLGDSLRRARHLPRAAWGMATAHAGLGLLVAGLTGASAWQSESVLSMRQGDRGLLAGYEFVFEGVGTLSVANYRAERGTIRVTREGREIAVLTPERRFYPVEGQQTTEAAIHTTWLADLYAALGESDGSGLWTVRLYHNPLVPWIWIGCVVMAAGGCLSLTDRRYRVGAPSRAPRAAAAAA